MFNTTTDLPFNMQSDQSRSINYIMDSYTVEVLINFVLLTVLDYFLPLKEYIYGFLVSRAIINKYPIHSFKKDEDPYSSCSICLEEYLECDELRVLLCSHAYHCKCIDPWFVKGQRMCPVCRCEVKL